MKLEFIKSNRINRRRSLNQKSERRKPTKMKENIGKFVKNHYIKSVFLVHHYYDKNQTFDVLILPMASKKIRTTYGILPMVTKACGGLG